MVPLESGGMPSPSLSLRDSGTMQGGSKVLDVRDGVTVPHSGGVQCKVVSTRAPISWALLRDHMQRGCPTAGGGAEDP